MERRWLIDIDGEQLGLTAAARKLGMKRDTLKKRLERGWGVEAAIRTPVDERHREKTESV